MLIKIGRTASVLAIVWNLPLAAQTRDDKGAPACALLTEAEIKAVTSQDPQRSPRPAYTEAFKVKTFICNHKTANWSIKVAVDRFPTPDGPKTFFQQLKDVKQNPGNGAQTVSGLDGEAWWGPTSEEDGTLYVARGTDVIRVQSYGDAPGAASLAKVRALMDKVLVNYGSFPKA